MTDRDIGKVVFDEVAELYDQARHGYPDQLFDDVVSLSGIPQDGRILEVGCGTGQATVGFARRGYSILCVEPGARLAEVARRNLRQYPRVSVTVSSFEDWQLEGSAYDVVIFADSFRWITPAIGYYKAAQALRPTGSIAIFRNTSPPVDSEFFRELDVVYQNHVPQLAGYHTQRASPSASDSREEEMNSLGLFENVVVKRYPWFAEYDATAYTKLLDTYSDHRRLSEATRRGLFEAITELIGEHGGAFTKPYVAVLHLARKK